MGNSREIDDPFHHAGITLKQFGSGSGSRLKRSDPRMWRTDPDIRIDSISKHLASEDHAVAVDSAVDAVGHQSAFQRCGQLGGQIDVLVAVSHQKGQGTVLRQDLGQGLAVGVRVVLLQPFVGDGQDRISLQSGRVLHRGSRGSAEEHGLDPESMRAPELLGQGQRFPGEGVHSSGGVVQQYVDLARHVLTAVVGTRAFSKPLPFARAGEWGTRLSPLL